MNWLLRSVGGALNWGPWVYGLAQGVIKGGATAASTGIAVIVADPKDFNIGAGKFWLVVGTAFMIGAATNFFSFLQNNPLPGMRQQTETTRTETSGAVTTSKQTTEITIPQTKP
jgi:hypothetical protein